MAVALRCAHVSVRACARRAAPAGGPSAAIERAARESGLVVRQADELERFVALGLGTVENGPAEFGAYLKAESAKWGRIMRDANIRAE